MNILIEMCCLFGFLEVHLALKETVLDLVIVMVIVGALEGVKVVRRKELQQISSLHSGYFQLIKITLNTNIHQGLVLE